jgi:hypothetical protein
MFKIIPIPKDKSLKLRPFIEQEAAKLEAVFEDVAQLELNPREHFYRFELPDGQKIAYRPQGRFGVQFGRHLLADFLDIKERADWKQCVKSEADESRDAERFKFMFKQFDFTMNEES